eukprot:5343039-Amphidinium_carterae.2
MCRTSWGNPIEEEVLRTCSSPAVTESIWLRMGSVPQIIKNMPINIQGSHSPLGFVGLDARSKEGSLLSSLGRSVETHYKHRRPAFVKVIAVEGSANAVRGEPEAA